MKKEVITAALLLISNFLHGNMKEPPAFHSHKEWFAAFLKNTDQKQVQKQATLYVLQKHFPHLVERIADSNYTFTSVIVGAGSGGVELPLFKEFAKKRGSATNFALYCEDPSEEMKKEFFSMAKGSFENQVVEYSLLPFEHSSYLPPQCDLALASHCFYFINGWKNVEKEHSTLSKFASLCFSRSGAGIITLQSKLGDRYTLNSSCATLLGLDKELAAEEIISELERLGIKHEALLLESHLNIASCFEGDQFNPNKEGKSLLSFLFFTSWDDLSLDVQEQLKLQILGKVQENGKKELILRDFHIWIPGDQK